MTDPADPADITPPGNPAAYAKPFRPSVSFWAMIALCVLCVLAGVAVTTFGPTLWPVKPAADKAVAPAPAAAPLSLDTEQAPFAPNLAGGPAAAAPGPTGEVAALAARISALEAIQARTADAAAASLAASTLADAAQTSGPFETELAVLERVLPLSPDVQALRDVARTGAPSRAALAADFDSAASRAAVAARDPGERGGLMARVKYALSSIVTIRRTSEKGTGTDAVLARAERQVGEGDLEGALKSLRALPPKAADSMAAWRERAQTRVQLDRHVSAIRTQALADLLAASRARSLAGGAP
jgi:hypothetical protein